MFGLKKTNKLIEDIDRYFDLIDESLLVFKDGVRNFLYSDQSAFNDKLKPMSSLDSEIEVLRRSIDFATRNLRTYSAGVIAITDLNCFER